MENFNALLESVGSLILQLTGSVIMGGLGWGLAGLILGIIIVFRCKKRQTFARPNGLWNFIAKCNYIIIPVAFGGFGLTIGAVSGAHNTVDSWIDKTTEPIIDYAAGHLPGFQKYITNTFTADASQHITLEEAVAQYNQSEETGLKDKIMNAANVGVLTTVMEVTPLSPVSDFAEPLVALTQVDIFKLKKQNLNILPLSLKAISAFYFGSVYWIFIVPFFTYLLVLVGELVLYRIVRSSSLENKYDDLTRYQFA